MSTTEENPARRPVKMGTPYTTEDKQTGKAVVAAVVTWNDGTIEERTFPADGTWPDTSALRAFTRQYWGV